MSQDNQNRLHLAALAVVLVVGTVGFFTGILRQVEPQGYLTRAASSGSDQGDETLLAPTHAELAGMPHGPNRARFAKNIARLAADRRGLADKVGRPTEAEWDEAVANRSELRAFSGAPPVIPHAIEQQSFPSCVTCHLDGLVLEERTAPMMSHELMANCTQCHVTQEGHLPGEALAGGPPNPNSFNGVQRAGRGGRAGVGAPPTIPHPEFLRERCDSCHGVLSTGLRTSHACQQNCQQCHAPASGPYQLPATAPPTLPLAALPPGGP